MSIFTRISRVEKSTNCPYKSIELNQIYIIFNKLYVILLILHIELRQIKKPVNNQNKDALAI